MTRRQRTTWPGKERQADQQPKAKHVVSDWLRERLDVLNRASEGGWFDEVLKAPKVGRSSEQFWIEIYARAVELENLAGVRSVAVAFWGSTTNRISFRARTPKDGDHL